MKGSENRPLRPLKWYQKLDTSKGRLEAGAFLVEGDRAIRQIIGARPEAIIEILTAGEPLSIYRSYPVRQLTGSQLRSIAFTVTPQKTVALVRLPPDIYSGELPGPAGDKVLVLEDIQDPGNVGALIRTAAAFDFSGVILTEKCADPLSPKCVQSAAGATLSLWLRRTGRYLELVEALKKDGYYLVAADVHGAEDPSVLSRRGRLLLALGNEASGLSESMLKAAGCRLRIPVASRKAESLNVAACGAICMYLSTRGPCDAR